MELIIIICYFLKRQLTGIAIPDGSLLEERVQDQEIIVGWGRLQGLDILGGFVELLDECESKGRNHFSKAIKELSRMI